MAGYGLMQAVQAYQGGVAWRQGQDQLAREQKAQEGIDAANRAAAGVMDASKAEWALSGAQGTYQPNDTTMFKAAQARGAALAKAGDWGSFMKNEAAVAQQRIRVRTSALQQYELDGDFDKLARTVDPTMANGKEIVGSERLGGMPSLASIGREATPTKYRFKFSDGSEQEVEPETMVKKLKLSLMDPARMVEQEAEINLKRMLAQIEADKQKDVEREKGTQARLTDDRRTTNDLTIEGKKTEGALKVEGAKAEKALTLADVNNAADLKRTKVSAGATLGAAKLGSDARRYAADKAADAAKEGKKPIGAADQIKDFKAVHDEVTRYLGERSDPTMGSGERISNDMTQAIASIAVKAIEAGAAPEDAIRKSADAYFRQLPPKAPKKKGWR